MTAHDAPHKNPARVPMVLQAMDDPAAHHEPAHLLTEKGTTMAQTKIEKDGIYKDAHGNHFFMAAGEHTALKVEYVGPRGGQRAKNAAPENKAKGGAPETKAKDADA